MTGTGMRQQKVGVIAAGAALAAMGLWALTTVPAAAGGLSLSINVPGLAVHAGPPGVAIGVAQPGFYGQIDIGAIPAPPPVIYARPVIITEVARPVGPPIYLRVPPGYERHWAAHCAYYHACERPVYFVREDWYQRVYVPRYRRVEQERRDRDQRFHEQARDHDHAYARDQRFHEQERAGDRAYQRDHREQAGHDRDPRGGWNHDGHDHGPNDHDHDHDHDHDNDRGH